MKTTKKFLFVSLVIGSMLTSTLFTQGQNAKPSANGINYGLNLFVYAGEDVTICDYNNFKTQGISSFQGVTIWKTKGDGVFENPYALHTVYFPGTQDIANGQVDLYLLYYQTYNEGHKSKATITDSMILSFGNCIAPGGLER
jgi:hypothetical protein